LTFQIVSAIVAAFALLVAWKNLGGLKRSQSLNAQMNLISLENEVRKNKFEFDNALQNIAKDNIAEDKREELLFIQKKMYELYISTADKLAYLIASDYLIKHFEKRDWKKEYSEIFKDAYKIYTTEEGRNDVNQITNIEKLLKQWEININ
jgi:hypothetical protein